MKDLPTTTTFSVWFPLAAASLGARSDWINADTTLVNLSLLTALTTASFRVPIQGCRNDHFLCCLDKGLFIQPIFLTAFPKDHNCGEQPCTQTSHGSPRPQPCTHISGSGFPSDACRLPSDTRLIRDAPAWPEPDNAFSLPAAPPSPPEVRDGQSFYSSPGSKTSPALLVNLLCSLTRVRHNILILKSWSETKTKQWAPVLVWKE